MTELRKKKDMTQQQLADKVDVARQTIISLEQEKYNPSLALAHKITKALSQKKMEDVFIIEETA